MSDNPYEAPTARVDDPVEGDDAAIRTPLLKHEASLKSVAWLYWLVALYAGFVGAAMLPDALRHGPQGDFGYGFVVMSIVALVFALAFAVTGWGFRTLAPWVRVPGGILSGLGLLAIPIGTLFNGYILYLMFGAKGRRILSPDYAAIRARTPHLVWRRSAAEWVGVGLILGIPLLLIAWMVWGQ
jgi:hypothetical protein